MKITRQTLKNQIQEEIMQEQVSAKTYLVYNLASGWTGGKLEGVFSSRELADQYVSEEVEKVLSQDPNNEIALLHRMGEASRAYQIVEWAVDRPRSSWRR